MKKKAYISPETEVVKIKIEQLLTTFSGEGINGNSEEEDTSGDDNRSRRRNVWEDEEEW